jgi:hypothetical protein
MVWIISGTELKLPAEVAFTDGEYATDVAIRGGSTTSFTLSGVAYALALEPT